MSVQTHFFTDPQKISQNRDQAFGPVSTTEFRLTSKFTLAGPEKAFAICKGVILLQPQAGAENKVNLILRPYSQPFPGLNIKYFVYRGLQKSNFFTLDSAPKIIKKTAQTSDFINKINDDFEAFHSELKDAEGKVLPLPDFTAKHIGFDPLTLDNVLLSSFFFKESQFVDGKEKDDFELPMIDMGKSLGNFAQGEGGIDVVLNYGDYQHDFDNGEFIFDLEYARKPFATLSVTGKTPFEQKLQREQSTQFIDITAFYGLFFPEGEVKVSNAISEVDPKAGDPIYNEVLSQLYNKNKVYLYIQSNRHRSYNYYDNYNFSEINNSNLKTGTPNSLIETTYGNLNWPIHIFESDQINSNAYNNISIQLTASFSYEEIALYVLTGAIITKSERKFVVKENLLDLENNNHDSNFTQIVSFKVPNINKDGQKKNISSLIRLTYIGKELNFSSISNYIIWGDKKRHSLYNNIFPNVTVTPLFTSNQNFLVAAVNKESLISYKGFSNYMNESVLNSFVVFQQGKKDVLNSNSNIETITKEKVLFAAKKIETLDNFSIHKTDVFAKDVFAKKMNIDPNLIDYSNYFTSLFGSKYYNLKHYFIKDSDTDIKILSLNFNEELDFDFYNLGISKDELNILKELIPVNASNIDFYLHDALDNPHISSISNISYIKYSLGIIYENSDTGLSVSMPSTPIYIYGINHNFLTSKEYTEYEEKSVLGSIINTINTL